LVAAIVADADPLTWPRNRDFIVGLAREVGVDVESDDYAINVLEYYLRCSSSPPRDFMRVVADYMAQILDGPEEGRLLLACALYVFEQVPPALFAALRRHLLERAELVQAAAVTARCMSGTSDISPWGVLLLVLGAHTAQLTIERTKARAGWGAWVLASGLAVPLRNLLWWETVAEPDPEPGARAWTEGVVAGFCTLAPELWAAEEEK
jgi:hypothetical protein